MCLFCLHCKITHLVNQQMFFAIDKTPPNPITARVSSASTLWGTLAALMTLPNACVIRPSTTEVSVLLYRAPLYCRSLYPTFLASLPVLVRQVFLSLGILQADRLYSYCVHWILNYFLVLTYKNPSHPPIYTCTWLSNTALLRTPSQGVGY